MQINAEQPDLTVVQAAEPTVIGAEDYALIVTGKGDLQFLMPRADEADLDRPVSRLAMALAAVANRFLDDDWVDALIMETYAAAEVSTNV